MARVTVEDVAKAVRTRWDAVAGLKALVPTANVFHGRAEGRTPPYAEFGVSSGQEERTTGRPYLQRFAVSVACYTAAEPPDADAVLAALATAYAGTTADPAAGLVVPNATKVIHCRPVPGQEVRVTGQKVAGAKNVVRVVYPLEVLIQGDAG